MTKALLIAVFAVSFQQVAYAQNNTSTNYTIRAGDLLRVRVWPDETLGGDFPVEPSGNVYLPFVGEFRAAGVSLTEVQRRLREGYAKAIKEPVVSVTVSFPVTVFGAVRSPGVYTAEPTHTLMDVIARAGGFTERAKADLIRIVRQGTTINFNAADVLNGGQEAVISLQSGDRVVVPSRSSFNWQSVALGLQLIATFILIGNQL